MSMHKRMFSSLAVLFCLTPCLVAAEKKTKDTKAEESKPSYDQPQPATENLDLNIYQRIRDEGQALPWSPSSHRAISGNAVWVDAKDEKDLEKYKGKLAGKIVFFGEMREVKPVDKPLFERRDEANLKQTVEYPVHVGEREDFFADFIKKLEFREKAGKFFADEHAIAIAVPSRDGRNSGGSGGKIFDDG